MTQPQAGLTGRHVALGFAAFFGLIIAVNVTMASFAGGTWPGLVVQNSYVESQRFNGRLAEARLQNALGRTLDVRQSAGTLTLELRDRDGIGVDVVGGSARIGRPVTTAVDQVFDLPTAPDGVITLAADLAPGIWVADVVMTLADGGVWRRQVRLTVKGAGK
jgi:nitrogen fixation protein FixH